VPAAVRAAALLGGPGGEAIDEEVITARYRWLDEHIAPLLNGPPERSLTDRVDAVLIHPVFGFVVFLGIMFVVFQSLFAWADPAITLIEDVFGALGGLIASSLPPGILNDLLVNGVIGGMGSVVVFLPQILLLFFMLGLLEDSGYMARVAYLMDRVMRLMNLNGRAFVPMLSGFACAIPAVMATRTMERQRDRLLTMMVVPLMTCSARLPIYTLMIGALFPPDRLWGVVPVQGLLMVAMYLFSVVMALSAAWVLSRTVLKAPNVALVLELPPYRAPRLRDVLRMMTSRASMFLREAGTVILGFTILLWALLSFPKDVELTQDYEAQIAAAATEEQAAELTAARDGERLRGSYGGRLGHALEPVIQPLGFDWKIGVGLIGAFAAREVFVSTMGVVYGVGGDVNEESVTLRERMRSELRDDGKPVYTPLVGMSLMAFFALACQCMSTLAVVKRETGGWRWPAFLFVYMTSLAWAVSFVIYQGGRLLGFAG
jgi:ferrous iron transport protein B